MIKFLLAGLLLFSNVFACDLYSIEPVIVTSSKLRRYHLEFKDGPLLFLKHNSETRAVIMTPTLWQRINSEQFKIRRLIIRDFAEGIASVAKSLDLKDAVLVMKNTEIEAVVISGRAFDSLAQQDKTDFWSVSRFRSEFVLAIRLVIKENQTLNVVLNDQTGVTFRKLKPSETLINKSTASDVLKNLMAVTQHVAETQSPVTFQVQNDFVGIFPVTF